MSNGEKIAVAAGCKHRKFLFVPCLSHALCFAALTLPHCRTRDGFLFCQYKSISGPDSVLKHTTGTKVKYTSSPLDGGMTPKTRSERCSSIYASAHMYILYVWLSVIQIHETAVAKCDIQHSIKSPAESLNETAARRLKDKERGM